MTIDNGNIGAYLLDWSEGRLSPPLQAEVMQFLRSNPQLGLHGTEPLPYIKANGSPSYANKGKLFAQHMEAQTKREEELAIALLQNDLPDNQRETVTQSLKEKPQLKDTVNQYKNTILSPDDTVTYNNIDDLKQKTAKKRFGPIILWLFIVALFVAIIYFLPQILSFFNSGNGSQRNYQPRTSQPLSFQSMELEEKREMEQKNSFFLALVPGNEQERGILGVESPTYKRRTAITEPTKKKVPSTPLPIRRKPRKKPTSTAAKSKALMAKSQPLEQINSINTVVAPGSTFEPQFLPELEITGNNPAENAVTKYPPNRSMRNNFFDALDFLGGKRIRYEQRSEGSYKLNMNLPYIKVERDISE